MQPITYAIPAGATIYNGADAMVGLANGSGRAVTSEFNGRYLMASPGDTRADVIAEWDREQQRSYFGEVIF